MKRVLAMLVALLSIMTMSATAEEEAEPMKVYIHVNDTVLTMALAENSSAEAFAQLLREGDVTVQMHDYAGFEKVGPLPTSLPRNDERITTVPGDVILYQGNQITIYYDTNNWSFTRLGFVEDMSQEELITVLGNGDVEAVFSLEEVLPSDAETPKSAN